MDAAFFAINAETDRNYRTIRLRGTLPASGSLRASLLNSLASVHN
jgi:hypothetical protein